MGKVHGSLTNAGKVKSRTPKVPKKKDIDGEFVKKPLTGRAKRRALYTRRFVNITVTSGGKRR